MVGDNKEIKYPITNISRLRMGIDGKGIRTLILLSGCPLRCKYCINPTTWNGEEQPRMMTSEALYKRICIDRPYILASGGGLTFGGGEPMEYPALINEIRAICEPEMTINVETSLNVEWSKIEEALDAISLFYVDIKAADPEIYRRYTGGELEPVMENLKKLLERKAPEEIVVRIPRIEGFTDREQQEEAKHILQEMGIRRVNLFDYRVIKGNK